MAILRQPGTQPHIEPAPVCTENSDAQAVVMLSAEEVRKGR